MKLEFGDKIFVTHEDTIDARGRKIFTILGDEIWAEWRGEWFLGCKLSGNRQRERTYASDLRTRHRVADTKPELRCAIHCMVEQLMAEGAL